MSADNARPARPFAPDRSATCRQCGADVDPDVARVLGDNEGRVFGCRECNRYQVAREYSTDASAATAAIRERGGR